MSEPVVLRWSVKTRADRAATWAIVSDSDRFNRLAGLAFSYGPPRADDPLSRGTGTQRHLGLTLRWQERPVRFTAPVEYQIERVYENGPIIRNTNHMHLTRLDDGTQVDFVVRLWPRSVLLRPAVALDATLTIKPLITKAIQAIVAALDVASPPPDRPAPALAPTVRERVQAALRPLEDREFVDKLATLLMNGAQGEQARLQPLRLAKQWGLTPEQVTRGCLLAVQADVLVARWELLCPSCRLPVDTAAMLSLRRQPSHCDACQVRYDASFADSVALSFRPHPQIRSDFEPVRCLSSPARMPHVIAQTQVAPRFEQAWPLDLLPGIYQVRCWPHLEPLTISVVQDDPRREQVVLAGPTMLNPPIVRVGSGRVTLHVRSKLDEPLTLLVERPWREPDTLTAGRVLQWPAVARLLPKDALEPGLPIAPFVGYAVAVQVMRGGVEAERQVGALLEHLGTRALQVATGWVTASLPDWSRVAAVCDALEGAPWLSVAVGHGAAVELGPVGDRIVSGGLIQELVSAASAARPGQVLALQHAQWPDALAPVMQCTGTPFSQLVELQVSNRKGKPLAMPSLRKAPLRTGDRVDGRFLLQETLGQGGFGLVFAAQDAVTGESLVVKLLRTELAADPEQMQRFFDEGRLAARLQGRHVVAVREWGLAEDGQLFLAMERLQGRELADILRELGCLDPPRTLRLMHDALQGLGEAHRNGLVHRDVKPANLFVVAEGTPDEHVKVIDFGIALDLTGRVRSMEQAGALIGTPTYMSPEQIQGVALDGRCDLYALAIVLCECLSGQTPFVGDTVFGRLVARLTQAPASLEEMSPQPLPHGLGAVVKQALAVEPAARPASADAMAKQLQAVAASMGDESQWQASWRQHGSTVARPSASGAVTESDVLRAAKVARN